MASPGTDDDIGDQHLFDGVRFFLVGFEGDVASQVRPRHPHASSSHFAFAASVCLRVCDDWLDSFHRRLISSDGVRVQYRSEMERRGGADAGPSGNGCTHVVVSNLFYVSWICKLVSTCLGGLAGGWALI